MSYIAVGRGPKKKMRRMFEQEDIDKFVAAKEKRPMAKVPGTIKTRTGSPFLRYRLRLGGRDFYVPTETASRREAERNKREYYEQAKAQADAVAKAQKTAALDGSVETFGEACDLYFERVGQHHDKGGQGAENTAWALDWLKRQLGPDRRLVGIDDGMVSALIALAAARKRSAAKRLPTSSCRPRRSTARRPSRCARCSCSPATSARRRSRGSTGGCTC